MYTVSQLVSDHISRDQIALEYLKRDLLNTSGYAKTIQGQIQSKTLAKVTLNNLVTSLARIKADLNKSSRNIPKFKILDLSLKLPVCELVFEKNHNPNPELSKIYQHLKNIDSTHFNLVNTQQELDLFISKSEVAHIKKIMSRFELILEEADLAALILKYDPDYRNYPGIGSQVLNSLAVRGISFVECLTTYSEFLIYIKQNLANQAISALKEDFIL